MKLASWLSTQNVTDVDFAVRIGVSRQALWRYKAGERIPRPRIIAEIARETSGAVVAADFFEPVGNECA